MKKALLVLMVWTVLIAGCGGGGGVADVPTPTLMIATRAALASTVVNGVQLTVQLPPGVTVAADAAGNVPEGALSPEINGMTVGARYVPARDATPATLTLIVGYAAGFTVGDLVKVACQVNSGSTPTAASFTVTDFAAWAQLGNDTIPIDGVTPELSYAVL